MDDWQKCFSKSRQRHYYFNSKLKKSVWTLDETLLHKESHQQPHSSQAVAKTAESPGLKNQIVKAKTLKRKSATKKVSEKKQKLLVAACVEESPGQAKSGEVDEEPEPMEIDDIIENIQRMRKEVNKGGQNKNELIDSKLKIIASVHKLDDSKVKNRTVAIIDTNVLLSNIKSLEKNFSPGTEKITFVIPWVVIQELDNCKRKSYTKSINIRAQQAIKYIHSLLSAKADNFIFENSMQNSQESEMIKCSSNDDQILKCALRYHTSLNDSETVLITNDKNLNNKALIYKVKSLCFTDFLLEYYGFGVKADEVEANNLKKKKTPEKEGTSKQLQREVRESPQTIKNKKTINKIAISSKQEMITEDSSFEPVNNMTCNKNKKAIDKIATSSKQEMITEDSSFEPVNNMIYIKNSKIFLTKLLKFIEREIVLSIKKVCNFFIEETSNKLELLVVQMQSAFNGLVHGRSDEKMLETSRCFGQMTYSAKEYDKINIFLSNNTLNTYEKLRHALLISSAVIGLFEIYNREDYFESFGLSKIERSIITLNYMKFCNENGERICTFFYLTEKFDFCNENNPQEKPAECDMLFQPIWEKLHNFSLVVQSLVNKSIVLDQIKSDLILFYQMNVCYLSIEHVYMFYNDYFQAKTLKNLVNLSFLIYLLYKLLAIEDIPSPVASIDVNIEFKKYQIIVASLKWSFRTENNGTMLNGLKQLEEFLSIYRQLDQNSYDNLFVA